MSDSRSGKGLNCGTRCRTSMVYVPVPALLIRLVGLTEVGGSKPHPRRGLEPLQQMSVGILARVRG